jgi:hypothetical protein
MLYPLHIIQYARNDECNQHFDHERTLQTESGSLIVTDDLFIQNVRGLEGVITSGSADPAAGSVDLSMRIRSLFLFVSPQIMPARSPQ